MKIATEMALEPVVEVAKNEERARKAVEGGGGPFPWRADGGS